MFYDYFYYLANVRKREVFINDYSYSSELYSGVREWELIPLLLKLYVSPELCFVKLCCVFNGIFAQICFRSRVHILLEVAVEELIIIEMINSVLKDA